MTVPRVSAICIFLDEERFLAEAIDSVLGQDFTEFELLLVDDGSNDGSTRIARDYAARHPGRISYLEHPGHAVTVGRFRAEARAISAPKRSRGVESTPLRATRAVVLSLHGHSVISPKFVNRNKRRQQRCATVGRTPGLRRRSPGVGQALRYRTVATVQRESIVFGLAAVRLPLLSNRSEFVEMTCKIALRSAVVGLAVVAFAGASLSWAAPVTYRNKITNEPSKCNGTQPAVWVTLNGVKSSAGRIRVQLYRGTAGDWLEKGKWIYRIEAPAKSGQMTFCMPVPAAGSYGIAVRHDLNGNGETDLTSDGGGMSNNPSINIFNLGKPSWKKTAFEVGSSVKSITISMRYM